MSLVFLGSDPAGYMDWQCPVCGISFQLRSERRLDPTFCPYCSGIHGFIYPEQIMREHKKEFDNSAICRICGFDYGSHSREALTLPNQHNWKWEKDACPIGNAPFSSVQTFLIQEKNGCVKCGAPGHDYTTCPNVKEHTQWPCWCGKVHSNSDLR